jgi:hypothetical protein
MRKRINLNYLITFILGLIVIALFTYYYFIFNKTYDVFEDTTIDFTKVTGDLKDTIKIGERDVPIEYIQVPEGETGTKILKINNKEVIHEDFWCGGPATLKTLKDNIIISYHVGCVVYNYSIGIYDSYGNQIKKIDILDDKGMKLNETNKPYTIDDNIITYNGNRIGEATGGLVLSSDSSNFIDICNTEERTKNNVKDEELTSATYQIKYLDHNKYSKPTIIKSTTVKEYVNEFCHN